MEIKGSVDALSQAIVPVWRTRSGPSSELASASRLDLLVREHLPRIYRLLRHLGVPFGDVDDATQQVFLILSNKLCEVSPGREQAFLSSTAVRIAWRWRRTHRRRKEAGDDEHLALCPADGHSPELQLENAEAARLLLDVLEKLPEKAREVFVLFEIEEFTLREIAEILDLPQGTVTSRLRSARRRFHQTVFQLRSATLPDRLP